MIDESVQKILTILEKLRHIVPWIDWLIASYTSSWYDIRIISKQLLMIEDAMHRIDTDITQQAKKEYLATLHAYSSRQQALDSQQADDLLNNIYNDRT